MNRLSSTRHSWIWIVPIAAAFFAGGLPRSLGQALTPAKVWREASFLDRFSGDTSGPSAVEPRVDAAEQSYLRMIYPLIEQDPTRVLNELSHRVEGNPNASAAFDFILGNVNMEFGRARVAAGHYRNAIDKFPTFLRAHKNLAIALLQLNDVGEARQAIVQAIELGDAKADTQGLLGYCHLSLGNDGAAETAYRRALSLSPEQREWREGLLLALAGQRRYGEAMDVLQELIEDFPMEPSYWRQLASLRIQQGHANEAAVALEWLHRRGVLDGGGLATLGELYANQGLVIPSLRAWRSGLAASPPPGIERFARSVDSLIRVADSSELGALSPLGQLIGEGRRVFGSAEEASGRLDALEAALAFRRGESERGVELLLALIEDDPLNTRALTVLAEHALDVGELNQAESYFRRLAQLEASRALGWRGLGRVSVERGKLEEGLTYLERAQATDPRPEWAEYLRKLRTIAPGQ